MIALRTAIAGQIQNKMSREASCDFSEEEVLDSITLGALQSRKDIGLSPIDIAGNTVHGLNEGISKMGEEGVETARKVASTTLKMGAFEKLDLDRLSVSVLEGTVQALSETDLDLEKTIKDVVDGICDTAGQIGGDSVSTVRSALLLNATLPRKYIRGGLSHQHKDTKTESDTEHTGT